MKLVEFQNIAPLVNIPSILRHGILSYTQASKLPHQSVALQAVQDKRDQIHIPGGLTLHEKAEENPVYQSISMQACFLLTDYRCLLDRLSPLQGWKSMLMSDPGRVALGYRIPPRLGFQCRLSRN